MAAKKNLQGAINAGIDRLFSANDKATHEAAYAQMKDVTQEAEEKQTPHKAAEVSQEQRAKDIEDMTAKIEAAEARKTAGRKGFKMQRLNISLTPSEFEYVRIMAGITGKSQTRFIGDLISREAERNADAFKKAKEIIEDARK